MAFAEHGCLGKALDRLINHGLALDTPEVEAKMRSKFIELPNDQSSSRRPAASHANRFANECVDRAVRFSRGALVEG